MADFHHFTTIVPVGIPAQLDTLETWHKAHGQPIRTLNHSREYHAIKDELPDWIEPVECRFAQSYGRDYLPFTALLAAIRARVEAPEDRILFVNSDISIADPEALDGLRDGQVDMYFASRMDVHPDGRVEARYRYGYDVISLRNAAAGVLDMPDFYVGLPWWDYILPLSAIIGGHRVRRVDCEAFHHVLHPQRWSRVSFDHIGWTCMKMLLPEELTAGTPSSDRVQKFSEVANQFLNGPIAAGTERLSPEEVRERFLNRARSTPGLRAKAAPKPAPAPDPEAASRQRELPDPAENAAFPDLLAQIAALRTLDPVSVRAGHADLERSLWLSCDPGGSAEMRFTPSGADSAPVLGLTGGDSGGWACLGMQIDPQVLARGAYLGLLMELDSGALARFTPMLRYYPKEDLKVDMPFSDPVVLSGGRQTLLPFVAIDRDLAARSTTCELNLFFHGDRMDLGLDRLEPVLLR